MVDILETNDLLESLKKRDPAALSTVFEVYANKIYRLALGILNDEQQADGIVQDTFLKLIHNIDSFEGKSSVGTWLYRVAYNECQQRLRKLKPQLELDDTSDDANSMPTCLVDWQNVPEAMLTNQEALDQMEHAIESLSPTLRTVFVLRDVEEFSTQETADILSISPSAVKVRLHRARLALREYLANYFAEYSAYES